MARKHNNDKPLYKTIRKPLPKQTMKVKESDKLYDRKKVSNIEIDETSFEFNEMLQEGENFELPEEFT